jgi:hypothetical protein
MIVAMNRLLPAMALAALLPLSLVAGDTPQASGKFKGSKYSFDIGGALAYWSRSADEGPLIEVAVSNDAFKTEAFNAFYDPKPVIDTNFADEQTAVVYFQFEPNGKYHGMSYYLGSGDGCGFCYDPSTKSTVRIANQRAKGAVTYQGENRSFDIQIDVPVAPKEWGTPLKGDGGEVGNAFRAYNSAMDKDDRKAIFDLLDAETQASWKKRESEGKLDKFLDYRAEKVHWRLKDARIVRGYVRDNQAVLLIKAASPVIDRLHGQVALTREGGRWKIADEVYTVGE